jgi:hypothetical protein
MQCPSCRFENMPGLASCGRCGSSLQLRAAEIDVHPPRASKAAKTLRQAVPRRRLYQARDAVSDARRRVRGTFLDELRVPLPSASVAARLAVPGWAHVLEGMALRGRIFLGIYLALLGLALLTWGNQAGAIFVGLAFSVHVSSALDVLVRSGAVRFPSMMATAGLVSLLLLVGVYVPAGWLVANLAQSRTFDYDVPPFRRFDVVVCNRWAFALGGPRPGDVVFVDSPRQPTAPAGNAFFARFRVRETEVVDRVVGQPGDRVLWDDGKLSINGVAVPWTPLVPAKLPRRLAITVPADRYLVLPSTSIAMDPGTPPKVWEDLGVVPITAIRAGAYLRLPVQRLWFIR